MSKQSDQQRQGFTEGGDALSLGLMKSIQRRKENLEGGSSSGGNNSEDSALVSIGNTSFGFNFDSEDGANNNDSPNGSEQNSEDDGMQSSRKPTDQAGNIEKMVAQHQAIMKQSKPNPTTSATNLLPTHNGTASLQDIAASSYASTQMQRSAAHTVGESENSNKRKRNASLADLDGGGYNTDDEQGGANQDTDSLLKSKPSASGSKSKKKRGGDRKREERNAREKERSFRIAKKINELRDLLSSGGVIVPKGTKSSVLTEAANYIRMLQQHQYRSEVDRQQLVQQMQVIGGGAHGQQAAAAIRHVAAQNGVWSLGNFGGAPPKSGSNFYQGDAAAATSETGAAAESLQVNKLESLDYRFVFNSCGIGMAVASMGGAFIECNQLFSQLTEYSKQDLCALTIFNLTARQDLQRAFDQISQLISPPLKDKDVVPTNVVLQGSFKNRSDLGLSVSLVKGEDGIAKCFCVTLVKSPALTGNDHSHPVPVSFESVTPAILSAQAVGKDHAQALQGTPAFTSG